MHILKKDLRERLARLDPTNRFKIIHGEESKYYLGPYSPPENIDIALTVTYAVGGAGAQAEIAKDVLYSLAPLIRAGKIRLNLVAGIRENVRHYFQSLLDKLNFEDGKGVHIVYSPDANRYFHEFNQILRTTDMLWTKPSELTFYCGLGIPIILAPSIGPHEVCNLKWIRDLGAGIRQDDPRYCSEWIMDYLLGGNLAQAAWDGFLYARKMGAYKIEEVLATGSMEREISPLKR